MKNFHRILTVFESFVFPTLKGSVWIERYKKEQYSVEFHSVTKFMYLFRNWKRVFTATHCCFFVRFILRIKNKENSINIKSSVYDGNKSFVFYLHFKVKPINVRSLLIRWLTKCFNILFKFQEKIKEYSLQY